MGGCTIRKLGGNREAGGSTGVDEACRDFLGEGVREGMRRREAAAGLQIV
jgi:hypothetical protein